MAERLPEEQGVGSSILPLGKIGLGAPFLLSFKNKAEIYYSSIKSWKRKSAKSPTGTIKSAWR